MSALADQGLRNRRAARLEDVAREPVDRFRQTVVEEVRRGWRLVSFFGMPETAEDTRLIAILADDAGGRLAATSTVVRDRYPALTPDCA